LGNLSNDFIVELKTNIKYVCNDIRFENYKYQGVGLETTACGINLIATDAMVLRQSSVKGEMEAVETSFVMNPTICKLLSRLKGVEGIQLSKMEGESSSFTMLNFYSKKVLVTVLARNLDCPVIDYKRVIPPYSTTTVTLNKKNLQQKVEQALLYSNDSNFQGVFSINGKVILTATDINNAKEYKTEFAHMAKEGEDLDISFNLSFLKKVLSNISSDSLTIEMTTQSRAAVIKEENVLTLVMPIMLAA
jgi:DNA polymerase III sliding clamp (beta) subunit (PCNA family)